MVEHYGPIDLRAILPADIKAARQQFLDIVHNLKGSEGHRAAVTASIAALAGAVDALTDLGAETAALQSLRMLLGTLEQRDACRLAGQDGGTLQ
jgi:hypothetical protein